MNLSVCLSANIWTETEMKRVWDIYEVGNIRLKTKSESSEESNFLPKLFWIITPTTFPIQFWGIEVSPLRKLLDIGQKMSPTLDVFRKKLFRPCIINNRSLFWLLLRIRFVRYESDSHNTAICNYPTSDEDVPGWRHLWLPTSLDLHKQLNLHLDVISDETNDYGQFHYD